MLKSMTGYGRGHCVTPLWDILAEVRSVNHRYLEVTVKLPKPFLFLEDKIKGKVLGAVSRGKIEVSLSIFSIGKRETEVEVNLETAQSYLSALRNASHILGLEDDFTLTDLMRIPDIFTLKRVEVDEEALWAVVSEALDGALQAFCAMRETEGVRMKGDIYDRLLLIEQMVSEVEKRMPLVKQGYYDRLYQKISELLSSQQIDEGRLLTEAAIFADKIAVDEETVRLKSHLSQFHGMLKEEIPVGRKLDFLVQEMNREANTIGSKAQDLEVARKVVDIKSEIEKIREQIQNIE